METGQSVFDILLEPRDQLLAVNATGEYSLAKAMELFKYAVDNALEYRKEFLLINVSGITGTIPLADRFEFGAFFARYSVRLGLGKIKKVAVYGLAPIVHEERFGETVAVNRGANVRVFTTRNDAVQWLMPA